MDAAREGNSLVMEKRDLEVAIIADDLSGGADCGVSFSRAGLDVAIQLDRTAEPPEWAQAVVVPTDSRDQGAGEARAAVAEAISSLALRHPAMWYKKIDSTLRGHLALELAVTIRGVRPDLTVVAPAFPAHGRTVTGGRGFLRGIPLECTETWRAQGLRGTADLPAMLRAGGLRVRSLHLDDIRSGRAEEQLRSAAGETDIVVCDAETEDDLAAVAASGQDTGLNVLWTGSAGLAQYLAGLRAGRPANKDGPGNGGSSGITPAAAPVAVVVGSAAGAAAAQLRYLDTVPGVRVVRVDPAAILDPASSRPAVDTAANGLAAAGRMIGAALAAGKDVALGLVPPESPGGAVLDAAASRVLSRALGELIGSHSGQIGGFALTGGDTALAVLAACGVTALRPVSEVATGVPVSVASPGGRPVVTKAGAFGDERVLARALSVLHGRDVPRAADVSTLDTQERKSSVPESDSQPALPLVAITMGDPAGIGPEIIVKALADPAVRDICRTLVIGDAGRLKRAAAICGVNAEIIRVREPEEVQGRPGTIECIDLDLVPADLPFGQLSEIGGETAYQAVRTAAALAVEHRVDAICTAPLNKEALHKAGHLYPGHTEMLAELTGTPEVSMMLTSPRVRVIHVTTHIGLLDMVEKIEPGLVYRTIKRGHEALVRSGIASPSIAVCGINPHAGEHGLFGRGEEEEKVAPGIERARAEGINANGPLPADTVFFRAGRGDFDLVVAMYHDQGHGPVKVMGLESGVNITVGLPVIRTSVDHGTAFDIAGTGKADHLSLIEALRQAAQLATARS